MAGSLATGVLLMSLGHTFDAATTAIDAADHAVQAAHHLITDIETFSKDNEEQRVAAHRILYGEDQEPELRITSIAARPTQ